jgi:hypothetical protein
MRNYVLTFILILTAFSVISCAPAAPQRAAVAPQPLVGSVPPLPPGDADTSKQTEQVGGRSTTAVTNAASAERMIVRTVRLGLEVQDTEKSFNEISAIAAQYKGYVAQTNLSRDARKRLVGTVTLRIPAESLDAAIEQIKTASLKVLTENSNANDVTDQFRFERARKILKRPKQSCRNF